MSDGNQQSFNIFRADSALEAVRASGFTDTARALFELIDNSIEAGATQVEVFGISELDQNTGSYRIAHVAVLDNGMGMDQVTLRRSLRIGDGTRFSRKGMGRFGVGLPQASIHQADIARVWAWQNGPGNALSTELAVDAIRKGRDEVPEPELREVPDVYSRLSEYGLDESGTLVTWSDLVRPSWVRVDTLFRHLGPLVGRTYRKFLSDDSAVRLGDMERVTVRLIPVEFDSETGEFSVDEAGSFEVKPLDPNFLMKGTSANEDFGEGPMFEPYNPPGSKIAIEDVEVKKYDAEGKVVGVERETHYVELRYSLAKRSARVRTDDWPTGNGNDAGNHPWGKDAAKNLGVSVVRAGRELELQAGWCNTYDPVERWWGVEICFDPELDEVMGVTNNKQSATALARLATTDIDNLTMDGENQAEMRARLRLEDPHQESLLQVKEQIEFFLTRARADLKNQTQGVRSGTREDGGADDADTEATTVVTDRIEGGKATPDDVEAEEMEDEEVRNTIVADLVDGLQWDEESADALVNEVMKHGLKVMTIAHRDDSPAFFSVRSHPGNMTVVLNEKHSFYQNLWQMLLDEDSEISGLDYEQRLNHLRGSLRLLLYSWARMEQESADIRYDDVRYTWGRYLDEFLTHRPVLKGK